MSFDDLLVSLRQEYLASIPAKVLTIERQIQAGETAGVRDSFHKLKGTGRTYGIPEVSDLAAVVEEVCTLQPTLALNAAGQAISILRDIYSAHSQQFSYSFANDPRVSGLRKLLQN